MNDPFASRGADQVRDALYSPLGDVPYIQVLPRVQTALAAGISGSIDELTEQELKEQIRRFLTDSRVKCSLTPDLDVLVDYIYHDMAGLSFITRDELFERPGFEEININAWNDVEIVQDGRSVKTDYSFLSPQHAIDIHTRMLRKTRTTLNDAIPRATADIGGGIRITVEKSPVVDADVAVASSIRKVNMSTVDQDTFLTNGSLLPEMMDFLLLCLLHGVSICIWARPPWPGASSPSPPGACAPSPSRRGAGSGTSSIRRTGRSSTASSTPGPRSIWTTPS